MLDKHPLKSKTTIFLHMPKTGGTTLNHLIHRNYMPERTFTVPNAVMETYGDNWKKIPTMERWQLARDKFAALPEVKKQEIDAIVGHMWFGWHELTNSSCQYVTFLRNPVRRFISHYNFIRNLKGHPISEEIQRRSLKLEDFLEEEVFQSFDNFQTKLLSGNFQPTLASLNKAIQNLENHFIFVGFTESFDSDLIQVSRLLGWKYPYYKRLNVSQKHADIKSLKPEVIHEIINRNQLDIALYEYVLTRKSTFNSQPRPSSLELWLFQLSVKSRESIIVSKLNSTATHTRNALKRIKSVFN